MVFETLLKRLSVVGEKTTFEEFVRHTELTQSSLEALREMLSPNCDNIAKLNERISELEKRGDELTIELKTKITSGAFAPALLENFVSLVELLDDLLDNTHFISREIKRYKEYAKNGNSALESEAYEVFSKMLEENTQALKLVQKMLLSQTLNEMASYRSQIEWLEERVDEQKDALLDKLYKEANGMPYILFNHLFTLVHKLDDLLDNCEDIADMIFTTMVSVSK